MAPAVGCLGLCSLCGCLFACAAIDFGIELIHLNYETLMNIIRITSFIAPICIVYWLQVRHSKDTSLRINRIVSAVCCILFGFAQLLVIQDDLSKMAEDGGAYFIISLLPLVIYSIYCAVDYVVGITSGKKNQDDLSEYNKVFLGVYTACTFIIEGLAVLASQEMPSNILSRALLYPLVFLLMIVLFVFGTILCNAPFFITATITDKIRYRRRRG